MSEPRNEQLQKALGPWKEPPALLVSGASGSGKTIAGLKAFGDGSVVLQMPGGARGWHRVLGLPEKQLRVRNVGNLREARKQIQVIVRWNRDIYEGKKEGRPIWAAIVDDITLLALAEMRLLRREIPRADNFYFYELLKSGLHGFAHDCRFAGLFLYANAHLKAPDEKGPGGPAMPTASLVPAVPHIFDTSVIALGEEDRRPWPTVLHCYPPGSLYTCKDRHNIFRDPSPMNFRELLNAARYNLPRHKGLDWQDDAAEEMAFALAGVGEEWSPLFAERWGTRMAQLKESAASYDVIMHWRWAMEDGRDRHEIRLREESAPYTL